MKRQRLERECLQRLPTSLVGHVCSMLPVGETLVLLTRVLKRETLVPWLQLKLESLEDCNVSARYGCLHRLTSLDLAFECTPQRIFELLARATNLRTLKARGDPWTYLPVVLPAPLGFSVESLCLHVLVHEFALDGKLARLVRQLPLLAHFRLTLDTSEGEAPPWWLLGVLKSLDGPRIRTLHVLGGVKMDGRVVRSLVEYFPGLADLALNLWDVESKDALARLGELRVDTCSFDILFVDHVSFLEHMPCVRNIKLNHGSEYDSDSEALHWSLCRLPASVRELTWASCEAPQFVVPPHARLERVTLPLLGMRQLWLASQDTCRDSLVSLEIGLLKEDQSGWIAEVLPQCPKLRRLVLRASGFRWLDVAEQGGTMISASLEDLEFHDFRVKRVGENWLSGLSRLRRIVFMGLRDDEGCLTALFETLPRLELLLIKRDGSGATITVSRREDGRLVKRTNDHTVVL